MADISRGGPLGWAQLLLLQVSTVLGLVAILVSTSGIWTMAAWLVGAVLQVGIVVEAVRRWKVRGEIQG